MPCPPRLPRAVPAPCRPLARGAGPRRAFALTAAALALGACLPRGNPCDSDLDCPGGARCVAEVCAGAAPTPAKPAACTDAHEPDDFASEAPLVDAGLFEGLRTCTGDDDFFALQLAADERVTATVTPAAPARGGALRLALHGVDGALVALAAGEGALGEARIGAVRADVAGRYYLRVYTVGSAGDTPIDYRLTVERETRRCLAADAIDATGALAAAPVADGEADGVLSAGGERYLRTELAAGETLALALSFAATGAFDLRLYSVDADLARPLRPPTLRRPGRIELRYGPVSGAETVRLRLTGPPGGAYLLSVQRLAPVAFAAGLLRGVALYEDRPPTARGLGAPTPRPIPTATVEIYRPGDDYVVGSGSTDAEGRFELPYVNRGAAELRVRVLARRGDGFVRAQIMRGEACRELYGVTAPVLADGTEVRLLARATDVGGAFNLHTELALAFDRLASVGYGRAAAPLDVYWERGVALPCGSCVGADGLYVGGGAADPDEYDDAVILHELGHYYEETYSRTDTPGGRHDGSRAAPTLAWSEGFATFFSSTLLDSPLYVDTRDGAPFVLDLETPGRDEALGTEGGRLDGDLSEDLVSALLWDLRDGTRPGEPGDTASLGFAATLRPTVDYFLSVDRLDRGATGVDLVDYLDGVSCLGLAPREKLEPLVAAHRFPYDFAGPRRCTPPRRKPQAPIDLDLAVRPLGPGEGVLLVATARATAPGDALRLRWRLPAGWALREGEAPERVRMAVRRGDRLEARAEAVPVDGRAPALTGSFGAEAALVGPGQHLRPVLRAWPEAPRRPPALGRPALSATGHPLVLFGGSP